MPGGFFAGCDPLRWAVLLGFVPHPSLHHPQKNHLCIVFFMRQRIIFSNAPALAANQAGVLPTLPGVPRPAFFEEKK